MPASASREFNAHRSPVAETWYLYGETNRVTIAASEKDIPVVINLESQTGGQETFPVYQETGLRFIKPDSSNPHESLLALEATGVPENHLTVTAPRGANNLACIETDGIIVPVNKPVLGSPMLGALVNKVARTSEYLTPGGKVTLEGFSKDQIKFNCFQPEKPESSSGKLWF
ncbi:MAG: hypothetical protein IPK79_10500 [Vampirovibrionales bacterium]|nr:hypothetical protein [Vampirovibrionales bacterium]